MQNYFKKQWIFIITIIFIGIIGFVIQKFLVQSVDFKVAICETEQQAITEKINNKVTKLNKKYTIIKDENRSLKASTQELSRKVEDLKYIENDLNQQLKQLEAEKLNLEKTYVTENVNLKKKVETLNQENAELNRIITQLQQQIKNYKFNSYSLFQAGKLELELSNLDQKIIEYYDNINQKKNKMIGLKDKCGKLSTNTKFCDEYDFHADTIKVLQQQIDHLQEERDDLKQRINIYLSSSNKTNSR